jgi:hypothetical protein
MVPAVMIIHPTTNMENPMITIALQGKRSRLDAPEPGSGGNIADIIALLILNSRESMCAFG